MSKIIENFIIDKYSVLKVDNIPNKKFNKVKINDVVFDLVPIFDAQNCIAIKSKNTFINENIEFIMESTS